MRRLDNAEYFNINSRLKNRTQMIVLILNTTIIGCEMGVGSVYLYSKYNPKSLLLTETCRFLWYAIFAVCAMDLIGLCLNYFPRICNRCRYSNHYITYAFISFACWFFIRIFTLYQIPLFIDVKHNITNTQCGREKGFQDFEYIAYLSFAIFVYIIIIAIAARMTFHGKSWEETERVWRIKRREFH